MVRGEVMLDEFKEYVKNYDLNNIDILSKYNHSLRVMKRMVKYAELLNYTSEEKEICQIVGLLHDIGRFEQLKVYNTYVDYRSVDHADYSIEQLFNKGEIKLFCDKEEWYSIIRFAIKYHNKLELPDSGNEQMNKIAKLLRDVDKMDVIYTIGVLKELNHEAKDLIISPEVMDCVFKHQSIDSKLAQNYNDRLVVQMAFVFDIHNSIILSEYEEYLDSYYRVVCRGEQFKLIYEEIKKYIIERLNNDERN